ncbi:MAG: di-heme oxidoredictase family protein [Acidobacteriota bacterium]
MKSERARPVTLALASAVAGGVLSLALACSDRVSAPFFGEGPAQRALLGGDTTVHDHSRKAFTLSARNLEDESRRSQFFVGNSLFNKNWVQAPASTAGRDGLGPLFNARSCSGCHVQDGRGRPPKEGERIASLLFRLSVPGRSAHGGPLPDPHYGGQFQPRAIQGASPEVTVEIDHETIQGHFADGTPYELEAPTYRFDDHAYGEPRSDWMVSPRVAPAVIGMGLLEAIAEETLLGWADPDDRDGDGISGRVNRVWDQVTGAQAIGRLGWKANQPSVRQQVAGAFAGDIGITSSLFPDGGLSESQRVSLTELPDGGEPEISDELLDDVVLYTQTLAVPARRNVTYATVLHGEELFEQVGCTSCHVSRVETGVHPELSELSRQVIRPYTDLLLHDMGPGLADGRPDFEANGQEWRTPPLWGIGLVQTVNKHSRFLHDGRARNLEEAVLWHGGEAADAQSRYVSLDLEDRQALLRFLESL